MRYVALLILLCVLSFDVSAQVGWYELPRITEARKITQLQFFGADTGYCMVNDSFLYKTTDGALTWSKAIDSLYNDSTKLYDKRIRSYKFFNTKEGYLFVDDKYTTHAFTYYTSDGGSKWTYHHFGAPHGDETKYLSPSVVVANFSGYRNLHISRDSGRTFTKITSTSPGYYQSDVLSIEFSSEEVGMRVFTHITDTMFGNFRQEYILEVTTNGGVKWAPLFAGIPNGPIFDNVDYVGRDRWLFDYGTTQSRLALIFENNGIDKVSVYNYTDNPWPKSGYSSLNGSEIFSYSSLLVTDGKYQNAVMKSTDGGYTWNNHSQGLPTPNDVVGVKLCNAATAISYLAYNDTVCRLFKTIDGGGPPLLSVSSAIVGGKELQVHPNPTATEITVSLPVSTEHIEVFDALGRIVYHAIVLSNTTSHTIDVRGFASGVYFVRLGGKSLKFLKY